MEWVMFGSIDWLNAMIHIAETPRRRIGICRIGGSGVDAG